MSKRYSLQDILTFGKYRGKTLRHVLTQDANYIKWCLDNIRNFSMDESAWNFAISSSISLDDCRLTGTPVASERSSIPYSDNVEMLLINPWQEKIFKNAIKQAEYIAFREIRRRKRTIKPIQLQLQFE